MDFTILHTHAHAIIEMDNIAFSEGLGPNIGETME